jgi:hypothetical protein
VLVWLLAAGPAWAECKSQTAGLFDWDRCWSGSRWALWLLSGIVAWWFCFHVLLPAALNPRVKNAPWPRDAFGRCLSWWWVLLAGVFLVLFAGVSDELRPGSRLFPAGNVVGDFLNWHWPWLALIGVAFVVALLIRRLVRHPTATSAARA